MKFKQFIIPVSFFLIIAIIFFNGYNNSIQANTLTEKQITIPDNKNRDPESESIFDHLYISHSDDTKEKSRKKSEAHAGKKNQKKVQKLVFILSMAASGKKH